MKTFKYRLRPSKSQRTQLNRLLELCRWGFNKTLAIRKNIWEQEKKNLSLYDTNKLLTIWKRIPNWRVSILRFCRMFKRESIWLSRLSFAG
jgi:transposase